VSPPTAHPRATPRPPCVAARIVGAGRPRRTSASGGLANHHTSPRRPSARVPLITTLEVDRVAARHIDARPASTAPQRVPFGRARPEWSWWSCLPRPPPGGGCRRVRRSARAMATSLRTDAGLSRRSARHPASPTSKNANQPLDSRGPHPFERRAYSRVASAPRWRTASRSCAPWAPPFRRQRRPAPARHAAVPRSVWRLPRVVRVIVIGHRLRLSLIGRPEQN